MNGQNKDHDSSNRTNHTWVEFVVGSRLVPRVSSGVSGFPSSSKKPASPNSNSTRTEDLYDGQLLWLPL